jgi:hypothetical protein
MQTVLLERGLSNCPCVEPFVTSMIQVLECTQLILLARMHVTLCFSLHFHTRQLHVCNLHLE